MSAAWERPFRDRPDEHIDRDEAYEAGVEVSLVDLFEGYETRMKSEHEHLWALYHLAPCSGHLEIVSGMAKVEGCIYKPMSYEQFLGTIILLFG